MKAIVSLAARSIRVQFSILLLALAAVSAGAAAIIGRSLVESQPRNEARSVADMVENIGAWASQYKGVWVKPTRDGSVQTGVYLEKAVYASTSKGADLVNGFKLESMQAQMDALAEADSYHSKNPALIQREISDVTASSKSHAKFRITASSVLNPANRPSAFESRAIDAVTRSGAREYSEVRDGSLLYARSLVARQSCLKCHGTADTAPGYIKTQFTGGGGFGYQEGKVAGVISVSIPLQGTATAIGENLTLAGWAALGVVFACAVGTMVFISRSVIAPVERIREFAEAAASGRLSEADMAAIKGRSWHLRHTHNEIHKLHSAIYRLGESVRQMMMLLRKG